MGWFERLCNQAGLAIHHVAQGVRERPDQHQPEQGRPSDTQPGETVQRVRRVTIEEVEIRSRPAEHTPTAPKRPPLLSDDQQNNPSDDHDDPPRIA